MAWRRSENGTRQGSEDGPFSRRIDTVPFTGSIHRNGENCKKGEFARARGLEVVNT